MGSEAQASAGGEDIAAIMRPLGEAARAAARGLALTDGATRNAALRHSAAAIRRRSAAIREANAIDMARAREAGLTKAMLDRLFVDEGRVEAMAAGLESIAELPDPLGQVLAEWERPNGLVIRRVPVPLGVIAIIYESRPNVTSDAAGLCLKSGNAAILRGGSDSFETSRAIYDCLAEGIAAAGIDGAPVQLVPTTDRDAVGYLLSSMAGAVDVVVPRGGKRLIERVQAEARVPVIGHLEGLCHVYLHESAARDMAVDVVLNAKMRRTGICGAAETVLVDEAVADSLVPGLVARLHEAGCEVRGDERVRGLADGVVAASEEDWRTEYLDAILSMRVVAGIDEALAHIGRYGTGHTESIIATDAGAARRFQERVDAAIVMHNASTQFADGGEFGMGAEIGISTGRIHARGPVGAQQLTSYKYLVSGNGQTRP